jgi:DNA-binding XRE family transcriptional regulator
LDFDENQQKAITDLRYLIRAREELENLEREEVANNLPTAGAIARLVHAMQDDIDKTEDIIRKEKSEKWRSRFANHLSEIVE